MDSSTRITQALVSVAVLGSGGLCQSAELDPIEVIHRIRQAETKLINVEVAGRVTVEVRDTADAEWRSSPQRCEAHLWIESLPGRKGKVEIESVLPWQDGPADFGHGAWAASYDGKVGLTVRHWSGSLGKVHRVSGGQILANRPPDLGGHFAAMAGALPYTIYFYDWDGETFSQVFEEAVEKGIPFRLEETELDGRPALALWPGDHPEWKEVFWLDPARNYALLGRRLVRSQEDGTERLEEEWRADDFVEPAEGVWYPRRVTLIRPEGWHEGQARLTCEVEKVSVNHRDWAESDYRLSIPEGYTVVDQIKGIRYRVGDIPVEAEDRGELVENALGEPVRALPPSQGGASCVAPE